MVQTSDSERDRGGDIRRPADASGGPARAITRDECAGYVAR
jgi:hypothetical protein